MALIDILAAIHEIRPFANENVAEGPVETLNARIGRKQQAIDSLQRLVEAYSNELLRVAAFILVTGNKADEFVNLATENKTSGKYLLANPDEYFDNLVDRIPQSLYLGKESISNLFDIVSRHVEDMAHGLGIIGYPQLIYKQEYHTHVDNREQFQQLIKRAIVNQIGGEIVGIQAVKSLTPQAIKRGVAAQVVPIMLATTDEKFATAVGKDLQRISSKVFLVVAGEGSGLAEKHVARVLASDCSPESVKATLKTISKASNPEEIAHRISKQKREKNKEE